MKTWNERLRLARNTAGIKAIDLARKVGVSSASVSDWESGVVKSLEASNLLKICEALKISPIWLQFGKGEMEQYFYTEDDLHAVKLNRSLGAKEREAWYRVGDTLAEPAAQKNNGTQ